MRAEVSMKKRAGVAIPLSSAGGWTCIACGAAAAALLPVGLAAAAGALLFCAGYSSSSSYGSSVKGDKTDGQWLCVSREHWHSIEQG